MSKKSSPAYLMPVVYQTGELKPAKPGPKSIKEGLFRLGKQYVLTHNSAWFAVLRRTQKTTFLFFKKWTYEQIVYSESPLNAIIVACALAKK